MFDLYPDASVNSSISYTVEGTDWNFKYKSLARFTFSLTLRTVVF